MNLNFHSNNLQEAATSKTPKIIQEQKIVELIIASIKLEERKF